jgi:hypothetical protein
MPYFFVNNFNIIPHPLSVAYVVWKSPPKFITFRKTRLTPKLSHYKSSAVIFNRCAWRFCQARRGFKRRMII